MRKLVWGKTCQNQPHLANNNRRGRWPKHYVAQAAISMGHFHSRCSEFEICKRNLAREPGRLPIAAFTQEGFESECEFESENFIQDVEPCTQRPDHELQTEADALELAPGSERLKAAFAQEKAKLLMRIDSLLKENKELSRELEEVNRTSDEASRVAALPSAIKSRSIMVDITMLGGKGVRLERIPTMTRVHALHKLVGEALDLPFREIQLCWGCRNITLFCVPWRTLEELGMRDGTTLTCVRVAARVRFVRHEETGLPFAERVFLPVEADPKFNDTNVGDLFVRKRGPLTRAREKAIQRGTGR